MKIVISLFVSLIFSLQINAQTPQVPSGKPGQLPVPKLQPLAPADLIVSGFTFVSCVFNSDTKTYLVKAIVTTRNNGGLKSDKTMLQAYSKTPVGGGAWTVVGEGGNVPSIDPGHTYSAVYSFKGSAITLGGVPFDCRVKTDSGNFVTESNETNNFSSTLVVNPRR